MQWADPSWRRERMPRPRAVPFAGRDSRPTIEAANPVMAQIAADFARLFIERLLFVVCLERTRRA